MARSPPAFDLAPGAHRRRSRSHNRRVGAGEATGGAIGVGEKFELSTTLKRCTPRRIRLRCGLASLEQAFHMWYHLSSSETSEECLGVPREVVPLSVKALTCLLTVFLSLLT